MQRSKKFSAILLAVLPLILGRAASAEHESFSFTASGSESGYGSHPFALPSPEAFSHHPFFPRQMARAGRWMYSACADIVVVRGWGGLHVFMTGKDVTDTRPAEVHVGFGYEYGLAHPTTTVDGEPASWVFLDHHRNSLPLQLTVRVPFGNQVCTERFVLDKRWGRVRVLSEHGYHPDVMPVEVGSGIGSPGGGGFPTNPSSQGAHPFRLPPPSQIGHGGGMIPNSQGPNPGGGHPNPFRLPPPSQIGQAGGRPGGNPSFPPSSQTGPGGGQPRPFRLPPPSQIGGGAASSAAGNAFTQQLNQMRSRYGLGPVSYDPSLDRVCNANNANYLRTGQPHGVMGNARRQNWSAHPWQTLLSGWMESPPHRAALLDPSIHHICMTGAPGGQYGRTWTFSAN